jgi:deoxyribodipyrimidine photo-lyase
LSENDSAVLWFRRDLRLGDHPALLAARDAVDGGTVLPLFVLDDALRGPSGPARLAFLYRSLRALDEALGGRLVVARGKPEDVVPRIAARADAATVHVSADYGPYGRDRDARVERALGDVELVRTGSPYAVAPGRVTKDNGDPYRVFTPFSRAWQEHGWRAPADSASATVRWAEGMDGTTIPDDPDLPGGLDLPEAGEAAASRRWYDFLEHHLADYGADRDRPDLPSTSRMSVYLKWGAAHPRTLLHDLARRGGKGAQRYRTELAWREFYADVLWHQPESARKCLQERFTAMRLDSGKTADDRFEAWATGHTGFPIVDAGMRQLRSEAWVHNRVRMIVASFLVKDLHLDWVLGAREFLHRLVDGDLASNNHGWQWVAGCGTDAAPYFRVFNPVLQGHKFDPDGDYVRRYVPELRGIDGPAVHEPWKLPDPPAAYPARIVDHDAERTEALARYGELS